MFDLKQECNNKKKGEKVEMRPTFLCLCALKQMTGSLLQIFGHYAGK